MTDDEMVVWHHLLDGHEFEQVHHLLDGHEFEQVSGVGDGQETLACWSPWGHKESGMTERLNCTELNR